MLNEFKKTDVSVQYLASLGMIIIDSTNIQGIVSVREIAKKFDLVKDFEFSQQMYEPKGIRNWLRRRGNCHFSSSEWL